MGYKQASAIIEIFKVKLRWSKSSRLLQRIAFLVINVTRSTIWYDLYSLQLVQPATFLQSVFRDF